MSGWEVVCTESHTIQTHNDSGFCIFLLPVSIDLVGMLRTDCSGEARLALHIAGS